jgi:anti-anti-sigma regulatory factor
MSETGYAPVLTPPLRLVERASAARYSSEVARTGVSTRLNGVLDGRDRARLEATVARWCQVAPMVRYAGQAHLDLAEVTRLEPAGVDLLNAAYARLNAAGWQFRVTPPEALEAHLAFNDAAIRRDLHWA